MILEFFLSAVLSLSNYPKGKITQINIFLGLSLDDTPKMGDDSVVACFGTKVVNYWNTDFASIPIEVSELISTIIIVYFHLRKRCYNLFPDFSFFGHLELSLN